MKRTLLQFDCFLVLPFLFSLLSAHFGCSTFSRVTPSDQTEPSGFLGDEKEYADLKPSPAGALVSFKKPGILKTYDAFFVEQIVVYGQDKGSLVPASSNELDELAHSLRDKIIRALGSRHTMFNQPARNVAILRVAITNVWSNNTLTNLRPGLIIPNVLEGGASMEALVIDSVSGQEVAKIADSRPGKRQGFMSGLTRWGGTEAAFDDWSMLLNRSIRQGSM